MAALKHYHRVEFDFQQTGSMYDLAEKLCNHGGFDLINLSGILYHVFSPIGVIAGVRPLLKRNGLMIVSTNVVNRDDYSMEFNNRGKLQSEGNTFWYPSIPLLEYMLRYLRLAPIDCIYKPHTSADPVRHVESLDAGYLALVCRATEKAAVRPDDRWALRSSEQSWEILNASDLEMIAGQSESRIRYRRERDPHLLGPDNQSIDVLRAVRRIPPMLRAERPEDSQWLRLSDES
jgi:hypothetical protein